MDVSENLVALPAVEAAQGPGEAYDKVNRIVVPSGLPSKLAGNLLIVEFSDFCLH